MLIGLKYGEVRPVPRPGANGKKTLARNEYKAEHYKVTSTKEKDRPYKVGDTLKFHSVQGYITVKLSPPSMFSKELFSTDPVFCKANGIKRGAPLVIKWL